MCELIDLVIINLKTNGISTVSNLSIELFYDYVISNGNYFSSFDRNGVKVESTGKEITEFGIYLSKCGKRRAAYLKSVAPVLVPELVRDFSQLSLLINSFNGGSGDIVIAVMNDLTFTGEITINTGANNLTILSGVSGKVTFDAGMNSRHFNITGTGVGSCSLNNLKLINGKVINGNGGSVLNTSSKLFVNGCCFENNMVTGTMPPSNGLGGGIFILNSPGSRVNLSTFTKNKATDSGGGIIILFSNNLEILSSKFTENTASSGGGIYFQSSNNLEVNSSTFTENTASIGGGILSQSSNNLEVSSSYFTKNAATNDGGGIIIISSSNSEIISSTFTENTASSGGGIFFESSDNSIVNSSTFTKNAATNTGGGIYFLSSNNSNVISSTFRSNTVNVNGGGILFDKSNNSIINSSTFTLNSAGNNPGSGGGGMLLFQSTGIKVLNSTLSRNSISGIGNGESLLLRNNSSIILNNTTVFKGNTLTKVGIVVNGGNTLTSTNSLFVCENNSLQMFNTSTGVMLSTGGNILYSSNTDPMFSNFNLPLNMATDVGLASAILNTLLANNGGLTETHALVAGSIAIDFSKGGAEVLDQRGYSVDVSGVRDSGSFEYNGVPPV